MQTEGKMHTVTQKYYNVPCLDSRLSPFTPIHKPLDILKSSKKIECLSQTRLHAYMFSLPCCFAAVFCLPCVPNNCKPL